MDKDTIYVTADDPGIRELVAEYLTSQGYAVETAEDAATLDCLLAQRQQAVRHGVRKVVFSSSGGAIYGEQELGPAPESHATNPMVTLRYQQALRRTLLILFSAP